VHRIRYTPASLRSVLATPLAALAAFAVCASAAHAQPSGRAAPPLGVFAERPVIVVPVQYLRRGDPMGWAEQMGRSRPFMAHVDSEVAGALQDRRVNLWIYPDAVVRSAKRNPTYMPDPYTLGADRLRPPIRKMPDMLAEPLASQVRTIAAVDNGRFILMPIELRFEPVKDDGDSHADKHSDKSQSTASDGDANADSAARPKPRGRAILNVAIIDARLARIVWIADIASDPQSEFSPALATSLAEHVADLFAAP
jgi:hypothetical protein